MSNLLYLCLRQDDQGSKFLIKSKMQKEEACALEKLLTSRAHKQSYYVLEYEPCKLNLICEQNNIYI